MDNTRKRLAVLAALLLLALALGLYLRMRAGPGDPGGSEEVRPAGEPSTDARPAGGEAATTADRKTAAPAPPAGSTLHIAGRVVQHDGTPVENCEVTLGAGEHRRARRTDTDGLFRFDDLARGSCRLEVFMGLAFCIVDLTGGASADGIELRLPPSRFITITVVDARGGPVPGVTLTLPFELAPSVGITDARGVVRIRAYVGNVRVLLRSLPQGGLRHLLPGEIDLPPGEDSARIVLEDADVATGIVLTPRGRPHGGAPISVVRDGATLWLGQSAADGTFEAQVPAAGTASIVLGQYGEPEWFREAEDTGPVRVAARLDGVRAGDHDLKLLVHPVPLDRALRVRVESPAGAAVADAGVELRERYEVLGQGVTDELGIAEFTALPESTLQITVTPQDGDEAGADWLPAVQDGVVPAGQEIIVRFRSGVRLAGIVLGPDGEPCDGASVTPTVQRPGCDTVVVGKDGKFSFLVDPADSDPLDLEAWGEWHGKSVSALVEKPKPGAGIVIRLETK